MTDYEIVIKVLYDLNIAAKNDKSINKKNTAHKYGISRGTVHNILNNYRLSQQEITKHPHKTAAARMTINKVLSFSLIYSSPLINHCFSIFYRI